MLEPALQMASCHLGCPPPVWSCSNSHGRQARQPTRRNGRKEPSAVVQAATGRDIFVRSVKNRPQDGKGDMILGCHLADAIRLHIDRQRS